MRGPPITITCECGERRSVRYGERWRCEGCGRRWNTEQIPRDEYRGLLRDLQRLRLATLAVAVSLAAGLVVVALLVNEALVLTVPIVLALVVILAGPYWKRKVRERIARRPRWELHPE